MVDRLLEKKVIGIKQSTKLLKSGQGKALYVAKDADSQLVGSIVTLASEMKVDVNYIDTMKDLGKLCGIDVGAAVALTVKQS